MKNQYMKLPWFFTWSCEGLKWTHIFFAGVFGQKGDQNGFFKQYNPLNNFSYFFAWCYNSIILFWVFHGKKKQYGVKIMFFLFQICWVIIIWIINWNKTCWIMNFLLKAYVLYFDILHFRRAFKKYEKMHFIFKEKSYFRSWDIQYFVFSSASLPPLLAIA